MNEGVGEESENKEKNSYLIVGLGNPGEKYYKTRHNFGFLTLDAFAEKKGWSFKRSIRMRGSLAEGEVDEKKVYLLKPETFMNLSGSSVKKCLMFYKIPLSNLLVVTDDVYLDFGVLRLKAKGASGGHKGLKNVEEVLGSQDFGRLRLGIKNEDLTEIRLEVYVLEKFDSQEEEKLPEILEKGVSVLNMYLNRGMECAMQLAGDLNKK